MRSSGQDENGQNLCSEMLRGEVRAAEPGLGTVIDRHMVVTSSEANAP
jgi:hypothetical protein